MATRKRKQLLKTLEQLKEKELKLFKWHLHDDPDGLNPIPKNKLENADEMDTVDRMVERYSLEGALKITVKILREKDQNNFADRLISKCLWVLLVFFPQIGIKNNNTVIMHVAIS